MDRGDVYLVSLDPVVGHEQKGNRRVLVVSTYAFNQMTGMSIVVPITQGGDYSRIRGYTVPLMGVGISTEGVVLCNQPRVLDMKARNGRNLREKVPSAIVDDVLARMVTIFE